MNIMDKTPAKITLHIDGMTWEQVREMIEERYGALMWDHKSTAYPTDSVVVRMAFAEPAGNVAQRAIGKAAPQQEAQEPVAWRELCRRLYVELFHCDQQMTSGERPKWQQGKTVRDVLADAKAALDAAPQPLPASQGDALDAARYRYLTRSMGDYCITHSVDLGGVLKAAAADAAIDAARAAQEGKQCA